MPAVSLDTVRYHVSTFNTKYKTNFDLDQYMALMPTRDPIALYKETFNVMLEQAIEHMDEIPNFDVATMLDDFQYHTISQLGMYIRNNRDPEVPLSVPSQYTGLTQNKYLEELDKDLDKKSWSKVDEIGERYKNGEIRIRDMVRASKNLNSGTVFQVEENAKNIAAYAAALKRVNDSRPFWWRIIHPIRNNAEQREARNLMNLINNNLSLADKFDGYLKEFKGVNPVVDQIRKQIEARINKQRDAWYHTRINPTDVDYFDEKKKANETEQVKTEQVKTEVKNEQVKTEVKDEKKTFAPPLKPGETALMRLENNLKDNINIMKDISDGVKNGINDYANANPDITISKMPMSIINQMIDGSISEDVNGLGYEICAAYDNFKDKNIDQANFDEICKDQVQEMFNQMNNILTSGGLNIPLKDKIVISQKAVNEYMSKLSPASYDPETVGKYADNYILKECNEFLKESFGDSKETTDAINAAREELGIRVKIDDIDLNDGGKADVSQQIEKDDLKLEKKFDNVK